ncbi:MAG: DEAD/DEAH box helicase family protein [Anaerolineae bacterium]|nr:DEAD/DEAH box helicase family protein [Anaerolineae bacterium]
MPSIVALDIETTGLNPQMDEIIEIGAVRFNGNRVEDKWHTLVSPKKPIPPFITQLTGITNEMVHNATPLSDALQTIADFVGDSPIVGHNIAFDLSFLQRYNILQLNDIIDTYELAAVLLPTASRYNLGALAQQFAVIAPVSHRGLDDAFTTRAVYLKLLEKANELPVELIAEFVRHSEPLVWYGEWVFKQILAVRSRQPISARKARDRDGGVLFASDENVYAPPLTPLEQPLALDVEEIAALLEYGGPFSQYFDQYEHRPEQVEMLRAIARALSESQHLMVEAGTGVGKSFAYLIPATFWAMQNNTRVVISTNTINLQDQLIKKDIPDLRAALGVNVRATVLKGRSNYLCPRRLESLRHRGPETVEEMRVLAKILVWLEEGGKGDRNEINLNGAVEREIWTRLSAENETCKAETCTQRIEGNCPFYQAYAAAQSSHLLIVNHALLLSDIATGSRVLPAYNHLIVDEAHHLESASTNALSYRITQGDLARMLRELGGSSSGVLGYTLHQLKNVLRPSDLAAFEQVVSRLTDLAFRLEHDFKVFFQALENYLYERREGQEVSAYGQQERIVPGSRTLPMWEDVEISWESARETIKLLLNLMAQLNKSIAEIGAVLPDELEDAQGNLASLLRRLGEAENRIHALVSEPEPNSIYWIEIQPNKNHLALQIAPLHVGSLMEQYLWHEKECVVMTSATLTTHGEFDYLRERLNADEADELMLGSPFDYESSALLYIANDIPEPGDASNHQRAVERALVQLARTTGGRMMVLFTSYAQLKRTSQAIVPLLAKDDIIVYEQGEGASPNTLLENFREADKAVLLGTRSFWEGVDIPGMALSVLVIVKLPFDVPSDPIIEARAETFDDPFYQYSLPEAILRFRQGFGRLIRTQSDRGVVVILDRRVLTKQYGKLFIESLPRCSMKIDTINNLPATAARWLSL